LVYRLFFAEDLTEANIWRNDGRRRGGAGGGRHRAAAVNRGILPAMIDPFCDGRRAVLAVLVGANQGKVWPKTPAQGSFVVNLALMLKSSPASTQSIP